MGNDKGLILFAELCKLWLTHAKSLQENRLLKTDALECNSVYLANVIIELVAHGIERVSISLLLKTNFWL